MFTRLSIESQPINNPFQGITGISGIPLVLLWSQFVVLRKRTATFGVEFRRKWNVRVQVISSLKKPYPRTPDSGYCHQTAYGRIHYTGKLKFAKNLCDTSKWRPVLRVHICNSFHLYHSPSLCLFRTRSQSISCKLVLLKVLWDWLV
jgi:hypothetical protein